MLLSYFRTIILYLVLIAVVRIMGKRQIGQMEPSEFVVTMLVANLASIPMQDGAIPLFSGLVPILTVLGVELVLTGFSLKSIFLRKILCGKPVILIENGNILQKNLKATRITLDELSGMLRQREVLDPRTVQYAILETNGNLSVFLYPKEKPASAKDAGIQVKKQSLPITLICDGQILKKNLSVSGKNVYWLDKTLSRLKTSRKNTLLLTVDQSENIIFYKKEK